MSTLLGSLSVYLESTRLKIYHQKMENYLQNVSHQDLGRL